MAPTSARRRSRRLESTLRRAIVDLHAARIGHALVGGLAVSVRTEPRFTRDADLAVAVASDAEAEALVHRLQTVGYRIESLVEQDAVAPWPDRERRP